jgi:hypothetical protein
MDGKFALPSCATARAISIPLARYVVHTWHEISLL